MKILRDWPARAALLLLLAHGALVGCHEAARPRSVVLITLDTLRRDHVSCFEPNSPVATPHLDQLAARGARVTRAWASVPLTTPSHASILTGLYPPGTGVRNNAQFRLPEDVTTLAEQLAGEGYSTAAFVASFTASREFGLSQGFEVYDDDMGRDPSGARMTQRPGGEVVSRVESWLRAGPDEPFFLWVHLFDPHSPYRPPKEYALAHPDDLYRGEVAYTDALVGRVLDELEKTRAGESAIVAVVSDHGEGLGTHGEPEHGLLVYEETIAVPFIVTAPGLLPANLTIDEPASTVDLVPTILDLLDLEPVEPLDGVSLVSISAETARDVYAESLLPAEEYGWSALYALRHGDDKYIHSTVPELYDLASDPKESVNRALKEPDRVAELRSRLELVYDTIVDERRLASAIGAAGGTDEETIARLESLGYVAGGGAGSASARSGLDTEGRSPREAMVDLMRLNRAIALLRQQQEDAAIRILNSLRQTDRGNPRVLLNLARAQLQAGDEQLAENSYRQLVTQHPVFYLGYRELSDLLEKHQRPLESRDLWLRLQEEVPGFVGLEARLAQAELAAGLASSASARLELYVAERSDDAEGWALLGDARAKLDSSASALAAYRRALELRPTERRAVDGALALLDKADRDAADALLRQLIERAPDDRYLQQLSGRRGS
ncbi:MAG: sulfatase-like hydrolase/transferase [Acidobacteriota bacterium]|nr:MAG: sulfatase-like hydrolase/transferase [Acidobacteriota bacterium]